VTVPRGGEVKLKISAERQGGFQEAIDLLVADLPEGVAVAGNKIEAGKSETQLSFQAGAMAKIQVARLTIQGTAKLGEQPVTRRAGSRKTSPDDLELDHVLLAVALPTPFKLHGVFESKYAARGSTVVRRYTLERGGFEGPITVRLADRQARHLQGVTGPTLVVPTGQSEFDYPFHLPPWMETGRTSRTCLMGVGVLQDPDGSQHTVSYTSHEQADQMIVLVDPGQLDVRADTTSVLAVAGAHVPLTIRVTRGRSILGPVQVELLVPPHVHGVAAQPITLADDQANGVLTVKFGSDPLGPFNMPLTARATAHCDGHPYTAETLIELVP
jgi:hypothetical protein